MKGLEGTTLGRYELHSLVAQGEMSEVYLGYDRKVQRHVAVKVLSGNDGPFVQRFEREAVAIGTLAHDNILPLYDFGEQRPWYYLVMPFVESGTLRDYLARKEHLTIEEAGSFLEQIAAALQYAHDHGVIHRDVKPSNILLRSDGHVYLADFGLAKTRIATEYFQQSGTQPGIMIGTPEYMAPEQSNGDNDYRSDIYSLGIILYEMVTGNVPFHAETPVGVMLKHIQAPPIPPRQLNPTIPEAIEQIILKALAKFPEERFQEAGSLAKAYRQALVRYHTRRLEEDIRALTSTEEKETVKIAQKAEATIAAIEQITPKIALPSSNSHLLAAASGHSFPLSAAEEQKQRKKVSRPFLIITLTLLLLSSLTISLHLLWENTIAQEPEEKKTSAQLHNRPTPISTLISIREQATLAAQARAEAATNISTAISTGPILYQDDMVSPGGGWIDDGSQCYFTAQGYHVVSKTPHTVAWCYSNQKTFSNATITVQAELIYGDFYALIFRLNPYTKSFYALEINWRGEYRLQEARGNNPNYWLTLIDWTVSNAIIKGLRHENTILIMATGQNFRFYINRQLVLPLFSDSTYTKGFIGFLAGGDSTIGTEAVFQHVVVVQK